MADYGYQAPGSVRTGPKAGFGVRFVAWLLDAIMLGIVGAIVNAVLGQAGGFGVSLLLGLAYYGYFEGSPSGQTVGKHVMNIRVVDADSGGSIDVGKALIRYVCRILSAIPCGLGYFWMLWDSEHMTWHDKLSNTVVVETTRFPVEAWPGTRGS
jgi:uncharacterized RDD family membrane protein YckC